MNHVREMTNQNAVYASTVSDRPAVSDNGLADNQTALAQQIQAFIAQLERYPHRYHLYSLLTQLEAL